MPAEDSCSHVKTFGAQKPLFSYRETEVMARVISSESQHENREDERCSSRQRTWSPRSGRGLAMNGRFDT